MKRCLLACLLACLAIVAPGVFDAGDARALAQVTVEVPDALGTGAQAPAATGDRDNFAIEIATSGGPDSKPPWGLLTISRAGGAAVVLTFEMRPAVTLNLAGSNCAHIISPHAGVEPPHSHDEHWFIEVFTAPIQDGLVGGTNYVRPRYLFRQRGLGLFYALGQAVVMIDGPVPASHCHAEDLPGEGMEAGQGGPEQAFQETFIPAKAGVFSQVMWRQLLQRLDPQSGNAETTYVPRAQPGGSSYPRYDGGQVFAHQTWLPERNATILWDIPGFLGYVHTTSLQIFDSEVYTRLRYHDWDFRQVFKFSTYSIVRHPYSLTPETQVDILAHKVNWDLDVTILGEGGTIQSSWGTVSAGGFAIQSRNDHTGLQVGAAAINGAQANGDWGIGDYQVSPGGVPADFELPEPP